MSRNPSPARPDPDRDEMACPDDRQRRAALLALPHVAALEALRAVIESRHGATPHVDPLDGGSAARCVVLLETPGPRGAPPRFVSRDNPTPTARNVRRFSLRAGLQRRDTLLWNAVPWTIHAPGARNRTPRAAEVAAGMALLPDLLALLPAVRVVILAGRVAGLAAATVLASRPTVAVLRMPHPSPTFVNTSPLVAPRLVATLSEAAGILASAPPGP